MANQSLATVKLADIPMAEDRTVGWAYLRDAGRVVDVEGGYYITHAADVEHVLRHPEIFSSKAAFDSLGSPLPLVPISFDPPEHTHYRKILQPFFNPRVLGAMLPSLQTQITELVTGFAAKGEVEVMEELAVPYPSQVFLTLFGLPLEDRDRLIAWKDIVIAMSSNTGTNESQDLGPALELFAYLAEYINIKRANPTDDVLSQLLTGEDALDDAESIGLAFLFVLAGLDTVTATIGFAMQNLARDPELRARVMAEPEMIPIFVEEIVRLEPPAPLVPRMTTEAVEIGGILIPKGANVYACLGSANRDETEENPEANKIHLDGRTRRHWGFGGGPHRCLGMHLARLELKLVLEAWHKQIPEYSIRPGFTPKIAWPAPTSFLTSLPLTLNK